MLLRATFGICSEYILLVWFAWIYFERCMESVRLFCTSCSFSYSNSNWMQCNGLHTTEFSFGMWLIFFSEKKLIFHYFNFNTDTNFQCKNKQRLQWFILDQLLRMCNRKICETQDQNWKQFVVSFARCSIRRSVRSEWNCLIALTVLVEFSFDFNCCRQFIFSLDADCRLQLWHRQIQYAR